MVPSVAIMVSGNTVEKKTKKSPGTQAKDAFFHLDNNYIQTNQEISEITRNVPMGWCCVFPHIARIMPEGYLLPEQGDEITCYKDECINEQNFKGFLNRVYAHYISVMKEQGGAVIPPLVLQTINLCFVTTRSFDNSQTPLHAEPPHA